MQGWIEQQMRGLTQRVEYLYRWQQDLLAQLNNMRQQLLAAYQSQGGGGSGGGAAYYCTNHLSLAAGTGTFPAITPSSTSATVYAASGGSLSSLGSATIYNFGPDATDSTKRQILAKNADGTYTVVGESCSAG